MSKIIRQSTHGAIWIHHLMNCRDPKKLNELRECIHIWRLLGLTDEMIIRLGREMI